MKDIKFTNKNAISEAIKHDLIMSLKFRNVDVDNDRVDELAKIVSQFYQAMYLSKVTHKEAESIINAAECLLEQIPIGNIDALL